MNSIKGELRNRGINWNGDCDNLKRIDNAHYFHVVQILSQIWYMLTIY
jgi:hypothetical protein